MQVLAMPKRKPRSINSYDLCATPDWLATEIAQVVDKTGSLLDPCSGLGNLAKKIPGCMASDCRKDPTVYGVKGINLFDYRNKCVDTIVSHPPNSDLELITRKLLLMARCKVYILVRLDFLATKYKLLTDYTPRVIYVVAKKLKLTSSLVTKTQTRVSGDIAYALVEWEVGYRGLPIVSWLPCAGSPAERRG